MPKRISKVILGVGGGIAAYKSCDLLRRLQERNYDVTVVPTPSALNFVGTATWEALSAKKVTTQVWESVDEVRHVKLAAENELILISPATADLIARIAMGRADDLLTNLVLASSAIKVLIPAMHPNMWNNAATVANIALLQERGFHVMRPATGRLTGADSGIGRLPDTSEILSYLASVIADTQDLIGKRVLITAGGTREAIDPVRYIGNRSSGKQGYAVAQAALDRGAEVTILSANVTLPDPVGATVISVESTKDLEIELERHFQNTDLLVMAAAVADARPTHVGTEKLKKDSYREISLVENPDLVAQISQQKRKQIIVGFAAETSLNIAEANRKLLAKGLDLIYLNDVSTGEIFGSDSTQGVFITADGKEIPVSKSNKATLAGQLLDLVISKLN
ncbi:MAG: bifunctional phosphopantothenoylcysteine decarboxylase/phosphopantothenate--cysteine ligase CoaBC [Actinobacteria bacterium]|nr:bifunctional phosphopantothenoylcysteine decarboxylase/phosphopantothenate--cysteine ligase CoaBC [Actinomycetota bacterium]